MLGAVALATLLCGNPGSPRPLQTGPATAEAPRPAYLPLVVGPATQPADPPWPLTLGRDVDALAIAGDRLYVGVGRSVVTYDISVPGAARRLSQSAYLGGRVARLAVGGDRLFAVVRPDDFHPTMDPGQEGSPPWTTLAVLDLSQPEAPLLTTSIGLWNGSHNHYAWDLAAQDRVAYLAVIDSSHGEPLCGDRDTRCGLMVIDTSQQPPELTLRDDLSPLVYRLMVHRGALLAVGVLPSDVAEDHPGFDVGAMSFDLSNPTSPGLLSAPGHLDLRQSLGAFNLSGSGDHVYRVIHENALLTASMTDGGTLSLLLPDVSNPRFVFDLLPRLALRQHVNVQRTVAEADRLHLLLLEDPLRIFSVDVADPLHPISYGEFQLTGINFSQRPARWGTGLFDDTWGDLVATQDARLFVAGGDSGLLVEVEVSRTGALKELSRYAAAGKMAPGRSVPGRSDAQGR